MTTKKKGAVALEDVTRTTLYMLRYGDAPDGVELVPVDVFWTTKNGGGWAEARHAGLFIGVPEGPDAPGPFGCHHRTALAAIEEAIPGTRAALDRLMGKLAKLEKLKAAHARRGDRAAS